MDFNHVVIVGRLATDPMIKNYKKADGSEGTRCFFRVAVTRLMDRGQKDRTKRRANFIPVVSWGEAAKRHALYLAKGTQVTIAGELIAESQKQTDGTYREFFSVQANDIQYGQKSSKNATPADLATQVNALQKRINEMAAGTASPSTEASAPVAAPAPTAGNPFAEGASA
jgi:single stranded DNA-binding protein